MAAGLEIVVRDASARRAVARAMRQMPEFRIAHEPSRNGARRIAVARLEELESESGRRRVDAMLCSNSGRGACAAAVFVLGRSKPRKCWSTDAFRAWSGLASRLGDRLILTTDAEAVQRLAFAHKAKAEDKLVATARIEGDKLVVYSCEPKRYEAPIADIPPLAALPPQELGRFEISSSGSRMHWPAGDVDLGLGSVRERADPNFRKEREARSRAEVARYAAAIRELRIAHGLTQKDIPGLSERQVRRIEQGNSFPHLASLTALAEAHGMSDSAYLEELARRCSRRRRRSGPG